MTLTLKEIESRVKKLAEVIEAPVETLPTFGHSEQSGRPHIEVDSNGYHYVIAERGQELERHTTPDIDELLYYTLRWITFGLAVKYELDHRIPGQDVRRVLFAYQEDLLSQLSPAWGERRKHEHEQILQKHPFDDH
ncbi:MAG TPA: Imm63 family immunity protein [Anaerolineales bacterium]|nr:Imm63 family immunity protein [Anaerolineales bacterium]